MSVFHDEFEIDDFVYDDEEKTYYYSCPCRDRFTITKEKIEAGEETVNCLSCSFIVKEGYFNRRLIVFALVLLWGSCVMIFGQNYCFEKGGGEVFLVIGDWGQNWLVIWWFQPKKVGDLVIPRKCGDSDLPPKIVVIWWFWPLNLGDL